MRVFNNTPANPLKVLRRMWRAKACLDAGGPLVDEDEKPIRLLYIFMGAGWGGAYGAGVAHALQEAGLGDVAKAMAGISSGVMTEIALATHHAHELVPFYAGLLSQEKLIEKLSEPKDKPKRRKSKKKIDLKEHIIDPVNKLLGDDAIHQVPMSLYAVVTESPSGKGKLIDLKNKRNPYTWFDVTQASMALPGIFPGVDLGGTICVDGAASMPIPLMEAIRIVKPTDILIVGSRPPDEISWMEHFLFWWYTQVMLYHAPPEIRKGMERIDMRTMQALRKMSILNKFNINCLAVFPLPASAVFPVPIPMLDILNPMLIHRTGASAKASFEKLLEEARAPAKNDIAMSDA